MTSDGVYSYTYDAKNQLVGMSGAGKTAAFSYEPQGRRISKSVTDYSEVRFAYDGWYRANEESDTRKRSAAEHLVAELNSSGTVLKKYTWGLDASGNLHPPSPGYGVTGGAGGVGGLLMIEQGSAQYYPVYDGRQNIVGLHNSSGTLVAWYVLSEATTCHGSAMTAYDPFGRLLGAGGSAASVNPFRFSTKYTDHEMDKDLVYYGLRYYHAEMGRFINRDPIAEAGGLNLYGFVGNSPTNYYDMLGMYKVGDTVQLKGGGSVTIVGEDQDGNFAVTYDSNETRSAMHAQDAMNGGGGIVWDGSLGDDRSLGWDGDSFVTMDNSGHVTSDFGVGNSVTVGWNDSGERDIIHQLEPFRVSGESEGREPSELEMMRAETSRLRDGMASAGRLWGSLESRWAAEDRARANLSRDQRANVVGATRNGMDRGGITGVTVASAALTLPASGGGATVAAISAGGRQALVGGLTALRGGRYLPQTWNAFQKAASGAKGLSKSSATKHGWSAYKALGGPQVARALQSNVVKAGIGAEQAGEFFYNWLGSDPIPSPTPGGIVGAVVNQAFGNPLE